MAITMVGYIIVHNVFYIFNVKLLLIWLWQLPPFVLADPEVLPNVVSSHQTETPHVSFPAVVFLC